MATGMGARVSNADRKYAAVTSADAYVSSGVSAGRLVQPFPGFPGSGGGGGDRVAMIVWAILAGAVVYALGVHWTLGQVRGFAD